MAKKKPDKKPDPQQPSDVPDEDGSNPYSAPTIDIGKDMHRSFGQKSLSAIGVGLVVILLFIVVGFGLLVGCCALGMR